MVDAIVEKRGNGVDAVAALTEVLVGCIRVHSKVPDGDALEVAECQVGVLSAFERSDLRELLLALFLVVAPIHESVD